MSAITPPTEAPLRDRRSVSPEAGARDRAVGRGALIVSIVVLVWSALELTNLGLKHTTGAEIYGVLTAALAVGAGVASVVLLRSANAPALLATVVLGVWALIALAGIAGLVAHIVGPVAGHGPIDPRPRPILAPLVFTLLGALGGSALFTGWRAERRRHPKP